MSARSVRVRTPYKSNVAAYRRSISANVLINTECDRRCPHCCYESLVSGADPRHFAADDIAREVSLVGDVAVVFLIGGEPTLHPDFEEVLKSARAARGALPMTLVTNGARLLEVAAATRYMNTVWLSHHGGQRASIVAREFQRLKPAHVKFTMTFTPHTSSGGGPNPCTRIYSTVSTLAGRVYPCCVACGVAGAPSTELSAGWELRVLDVEAPCERCVFGA